MCSEMIKILQYLKSALLVVSFGVLGVGYLVGNFNVLLIGVLCIFCNNLISGFLNWRTHVVFLFLHFTLFTFLLSRPLISMFKGYNWWHFGNDATMFALNALVLTMLALRIGAKVAVKISKSRKPSNHILKTQSSNTDFVSTLQLISLVIFFIALFFFLLCEAEKLVYMHGKNYEEYYLSFESKMPYYIRTFASFMKYALCIFLATLPSKQKAFIPLVFFVLSAFPSLIIGIRNHIVLNCVFALVYYLLRDIFDNDHKWFGKFERMALILAAPIALLFLSSYNYLREGVSVDMSITESVTDFFFKQGVSFDVLCRGYNAIPDLPDVIPKNYTFGGIIDYFKHGGIAQILFNAADLGTQNSEFRAIYGNSFAHSMSYVAHPGYLQGHGLGSSYLLETYADFGYLGIIIFSLIIGAVTVLMISAFRKGTLWRTITLISLTSFFFIPRAEATGWLNFLFTPQFWVITFFCYFCATVLSDKSEYTAVNISHYVRKCEVNSMLKYFGLKEILYGIKKFSVLILAVTVVFAGLGFVFGEVKNNDDGVSDTTKYSSSRSYIITSQLKTSVEPQSISDRACASTAAALLYSDYSKAYVLEKLLNDYSADEIIEYTGSNVSKDNLSYTVLNDSITVSVLSDTSIVNIFTTVGNIEFSKKMIAYFDEYFTNNIAQQIPNLQEYTPVGGTTIPIETAVGMGLGSSVTKAVVFGIIGLVCSVLCVMLYVLFKPSVATRKDFEDYGITVIDDTGNHKSDNYTFAANAMKLYADKNDAETIAIVSSLSSRCFIADADKFIKQLNDGNSVNKAFGIIAEFSEFEKIKDSKSVVLLERRGSTNHSDFAKTLSLLNQYKIQVLGVILI